MKGSPAEKAGIKQGDVILQYNGKIVEDTGHLRNMVSQTPIGTTVKVKILRQKKELDVEVKIAELTKKMAEASPGEEESGGSNNKEKEQEESSVLSGMVVRELTPALAARFGFEEKEKGMVVLKVEAASRIYEAGIRPGDIILQINQKNVATLDEYKKVASKIKANERILLLLRRKGQDLFVTVKPE
jgi:serine protease Do